MTKTELDELLTKAKELLKSETTAFAYDTWMKNLSIESFDGGNLVLSTETTFEQKAIETRYKELIIGVFNHLTNKQCNVNIISKEDSDSSLDIPEQIHINSSMSLINTNINEKLTFDNFVVGNSNRFAHAAALAVSENPGKMYNPLFIYSGTGLGKTHLMHAIGNEILRENSNLKVLYITTEFFTNQLVNALKDNKMEAFRNKYRNNVDVLLIDDIQFIGKKERTQEEFFHTFETLHNAGKQIVISSDRPPKDIPFLEERLKSRFEWGIMADIGSPDYETRLAILRKKAETENTIVDDSILANIATKMDTNIRELEGVFKKLVTRANLMNSPITMEMSEWAMNDVISNKKAKDKVISSQYIIEEVSKYFNVDVRDIVGPKRNSDIVFPRQVAMYLCSTVPQLSTTQIGRDFGGRDHTTVMHSIDKIDKKIKDEKDSTTKLVVESLKNILLSKESEE